MVVCRPPGAEVQTLDIIGLFLCPMTYATVKGCHSEFRYLPYGVDYHELLATEWQPFFSLPIANNS